MAELERELRGLAAELAWPPTPNLALPLEQRRRRPRLRPVWLAVAAALVALAVALSVPGARSAILRIFHLGGVTVERVDTLPPAKEQPLTQLGPVVHAAAAQAALGGPVRLPKLKGPPPQLQLRDGVVSVVLKTPQPLLLSEFREGAFLLKKIAATSTHIVYVKVGNGPGLWIAGARHLLVLPSAPPRLAGNVLVWQVGPITYRLEGKELSRHTALRLAAEIDGT
ncbi:MAG: hypothetical protein ACXVY8_03585 [Gaiellaceae bacterium]